MELKTTHARKAMFVFVLIIEILLNLEVCTMERKKTRGKSAQGMNAQKQ
jgi:hypothetical protein